MVQLGTSSLIERLDYEDYSNAQLAGPPLAVFALAVLVLLGTFVTTGAPVALGVDFAGGTELRVAPADGADADELEGAFPTEPSSVREVPADGTYVVTFAESEHDVEELEQAAEDAGYDIQASSEVPASFGSDAQRLALYGLAAAFLAMSIVVIGLFRSPIPALAVILSATSDLVIPLAVMSLLSIELTLGTVAALLMLIGYSVDSDILLNDYVLRRGGEFYESVYSAMDTGVTMTLTSLLAMVVMAVSARILGVGLLWDIGFVLAVGLTVDLMNTYMMNLSLLRWYKFKGVNRL